MFKNTIFELLKIKMYSLELVYIISTQSIKMGVIGSSQVCHGSSHFKEVNDTYNFEASKFAGSI